VCEVRLSRDVRSPVLDVAAHAHNIFKVIDSVGKP